LAALVGYGIRKLLIEIAGEYLAQRLLAQCRAGLKGEKER
jgi:hypothetical protein